MPRSEQAVFITKVIEDRLDCEYYHPKYDKFYRTLAESRHAVKNLGDEDVAYITDGDHGNPIYVDNGILFLRAVNVTVNGIDLENDTRYIPEIENKRILKSELKPNDVLLVVVGATIGKTALVPENFGKANISRDIAKIEVSKDINPRYILFYLESAFGQSQIKRYITGSAQGGLYLKNIKELKVLLPDRAFQNKIVEEVQKHKDIAKNSLQQYRHYLNDIKLVLRENLKIDLNEKDIGVFTARLSELTGRLDVFSYYPSYKMLLKQLNESESNGYCKLIKGSGLNIQQVQIEKGHENKSFKYVDLGNTEKDFGKIIGFEEDILINLPSRARQTIYENDILIPRPVGSTEGIVIVPKEFNKQLCSTGFILIRPKDHDEAVLLWTILKSDLVQRQFFYLQSGSLQPEITPRNFMDRVIIPIPNEKIRNKIIIDIKEKTILAKKYLYEYNDNMEKSKKVFETLMGLNTNGPNLP